ncbi:MAG TPA: ABC transporter permease [Chloroflexota bacterium]
MIPVIGLTLRALGRGRRLLVVGALLLVPGLLMLTFLGSGSNGDSGTFGLQLFDRLVLPVLLPLTALIFATSALGNEREDGSLPYLTLRPVSRIVLVWAKLIAATIVTAGLVVASLLLMYLVGLTGAWGGSTLSSALVASALGCFAYCALFLGLGLVAPRRGLIVGLVYVLTWEGTAALFSPALATFSIRRYAEGVLDSGLSADQVSQIRPVDLGGTASVVVLCVFVAVCTGFTTWWLRRLQLP